LKPNEFKIVKKSLDFNYTVKLNGYN